MASFKNWSLLVCVLFSIVLLVSSDDVHTTSGGNYGGHVDDEKYGHGGGGYGGGGHGGGGHGGGGHGGGGHGGGGHGGHGGGHWGGGGGHSGGGHQ